MIYVVTLALVAVNSIAAFGRRHSKLLAVSLLCFMWVLFWGNQATPDTPRYLALYNSVGSGTLDIEPGFALLMQLSVGAGLSYTAFVALLSLVGLGLIHATVRHFTSNWNYVYALYLIYPFLFDAIQIRNFLAVSIVTFAARYLTARRRGLLAFVALVLVASTIHVIALFYLILLLATSERLRTLVIATVSLASLLTVVTVFFAPSLEVVRQAVAYISDTDKRSVYLESRTRFGFLIIIAKHVAGLLLLTHATRSLPSLSSTMPESDDQPLASRQRRLVTVAQRACMIMLGLMPLYVINSNFWRPTRNLQILFLVAFAAYNDLAWRSRSRSMFNLGVTIYILAMFAIDILSVSDEIILPIFSQGVLADMLGR